MPWYAPRKASTSIAGRSSHELQRGFDRIGAGGTTELDAGVLGELRREGRQQRIEKRLAFGGGQVEGVCRAFAIERLPDRPDDCGVVVP
jgi:hypothetical protein